MVLSNCRHSHENEDQGLTDTAQHLHEIFYCCIGFLGNIFLHIFIHGHGTSCNPERETQSSVSLPFHFSILLFKIQSMTYSITNKSQSYRFSEILFGARDFFLFFFSMIGSFLRTHKSMESFAIFQIHMRCSEVTQTMHLEIGRAKESQNSSGEQELLLLLLLKDIRKTLFRY